MHRLNSLLRKFQSLALWLRPMQIPLHSARTCFFLVLSIFPSLLLLLGLLRYTAYGSDELLALLAGWLPQSLLGVVSALVDASYRHSSGMVVSVSALATLWSASKGTYGLLDGLNAVYGVTDHRGYWRRRCRSVSLTFLLLLTLVLTLVLNVFGNALLDFLQMTTRPAVLVLVRWLNLKAILLLMLQTALFTLMYALLPGRRNRLMQSLPGAVVASVSWSVFSALFELYVSHFARYTNIYGSVYALALGMLWLYFCIGILFAGGAFNRWLAERKN